MGGKGGKKNSNNSEKRTAIFGYREGGGEKKKTVPLRERGETVNSKNLRSCLGNLNRRSMDFEVRTTREK